MYFVPICASIFVRVCARCLKKKKKIGINKIKKKKTGSRTQKLVEMLNKLRGIQSTFPINTLRSSVRVLRFVGHCCSRAVCRTRIAKYTTIQSFILIPIIWLTNNGKRFFDRWPRPDEDEAAGTGFCYVMYANVLMKRRVLHVNQLSGYRNMEWFWMRLHGPPEFIYRHKLRLLSRGFVFLHIMPV